MARRENARRARKRSVTWLFCLAFYHNPILRLGGVEMRRFLRKIYRTRFSVVFGPDFKDVSFTLLKLPIFPSLDILMMCRLRIPPCSKPTEIPPTIDQLLYFVWNAEAAWFTVFEDRRARIRCRRKHIFYCCIEIVYYSRRLRFFSSFFYHINLSTRKCLHHLDTTK